MVYLIVDAFAVMPVPEGCIVPISIHMQQNYSLVELASHVTWIKDFKIILWGFQSSKSSKLSLATLTPNFVNFYITGCFYFSFFFPILTVLRLLIFGPKWQRGNIKLYYYVNIKKLAHVGGGGWMLFGWIIWIIHKLFWYTIVYLVI